MLNTTSAGVPGEPPAPRVTVNILLQPSDSSSHSPQLMASQITASMASLVRTLPPRSAIVMGSTSYSRTAEISAVSLTTAFSSGGSAPNASEDQLGMLASSMMSFF